MIQVYQKTYNPFQQNMSILVNQEREAIIVDPGCYDRNEEQDLLDFIEKHELKPIRLINTHFHLDHILGNQFVAEKFGLKVESHSEGIPVLEMAETSAKLYGFEGYKESPEMEVEWRHGDEIQFGSNTLRVLFVPGHCPGHIALVSDEDQFVIGGDVLFNGSIGRTDLPGGDYAILEKSIMNHFYTLPDAYKVYCGHGPSTTIGHEKRSNPFVRV
jgi:glyoxylase-like metal-dependent hydrolase (beta-lactamase superfamily II)